MPPFTPSILTTNGHEGSKPLTVVEVPPRGTLTVVDSCLDAAVRVLSETIANHCKPPSTTVNGSPCKRRLTELTTFGPDTLDPEKHLAFNTRLKKLGEQAASKGGR